MRERHPLTSSRYYFLKIVCSREDLLLVSQSFGEMVVHRWQGVGDIATVWKWGAFEACGVATVLWRREARPWRLL
jgi:hypothetical protein